MTSSLLLFIGPTISRAEAAAQLDAIILPPAKQGDVYAAYLEYKPAAMGIIDGHFENVPAPWHKEILWVMAQGVRVYGASSMGALRAAELYPFGMIGVGDIFSAYKNGILQDDDEVAVIHGPAELGYPLVCEAMVNIRRTLEDALSADIINSIFHDEAVAIAKSLFYRDRTWWNILSSLPAAPDFEVWLQAHKRDLKKEDAISMLRQIESDMPFQPVLPRYEFQDTVFWRTMKQQIEDETSHDI